MVHDDNVLNFEEIVHRRNRLQSRKGATTCVGHGKQCPSVADPVAGFVENILAWVNLVPEMGGHRLRNFSCSRVKAVDHDGLHRDELAESLEIRSVKPGLLK